MTWCLYVYVLCFSWEVFTGQPQYVSFQFTAVPDIPHTGLCLPQGVPGEEKVFMLTSDLAGPCTTSLMSAQGPFAYVVVFLESLCKFSTLVSRLHNAVWLQLWLPETTIYWVWPVFWKFVIYVEWERWCPFTCVQVFFITFSGIRLCDIVIIFKFSLFGFVLEYCQVDVLLFTCTLMHWWNAANMNSMQSTFKFYYSLVMLDVAADDIQVMILKYLFNMNSFMNDFKISI